MAPSSVPESTIPTVKAHLVQEIAEAVADPMVLVCYDDPGPHQPEGIIAVRDVVQKLAPLELVGGGGTGWLLEEYEVEVIVDVFRGGDHAQATFERACQLVSLVEQTVRADPSLGGLVITAYLAGTGYSCGWEEDGKGRIVTATMHVHVEARQ